jgi:retron-type reverse transcriptase
LSKIAENIIIEYELKSKLLRKMDPMQFGFIPGSNTTLALISMMHTWLAALDWTGSTVRVVPLDYRKAFDPVDHNLLVAKLSNYEIKPTVVHWIKINSVHSNFLQVPAGIPQGTKIGPWLFLAIINDLCIAKSPTSNLWKFADDTSVSEVIPKDGVSSLNDNKF